MPDPGTSDRERVAREALLEITGAETIGDLLDETVEADGVITVRFASLLIGYPGWHWSVSLAEVAGGPPTALEAELMPGEGALLAPEWVPWSDRVGDVESGEEEPDVADLDDVDDVDDDLDPDEVDDGIDFETDDDPDTPDDPTDSGVVAPVGIEEHDETEPEADEGGPEPPLVTAVKKRRQRKKKGAEGD